MNRDFYNEKKKLSRWNEKPDDNWASDVSFASLEKKIKENKKAIDRALRPLSDKKNVKTEKNVPSSVLKKSNNKFMLFMGIWCFVLILFISIFLTRFYFYLADYEKVYNESLPYHVMDEFMKVFDDNKSDNIYDHLTVKPVTGEFEDEENIKHYLSELLENKTLTYTESNESTDKIPQYYILADDYIVGTVSLTQSDKKRSHDLPVYKVSDFEIYSQAEHNIRVQSYDNCTLYINDTKVSPEYIYQIETLEEKHFEGFTQLPLKKYYLIQGLYEKPAIKVINSFNEEVTPELNNKTGVYETPLTTSKETKEEMIAFAKEAVSTYAKVVCREVNDSALDDIFTKDNKIVKDIKSNRDNLKYFPNHKTTGVDDTVKEFIPYSEEAFFCEIEHVQHMLIYGVREKDVTTDAKFFYYKEDGEWKVCAMIF